MVLGRLAATAALGVVVATWFVVLGLAFGARVEAGVAGVLLIFVLVPLSAMAFGGLGAALALAAGRASVVQGIFPLVFVILFLSSAFFPRSLMLEPAATVALYNPLSLIAEGIRAPVIAGISVASLAQGLLGIAIVGGLGFALSALALRRRLRIG